MNFTVRTELQKLTTAFDGVELARIAAVIREEYRAAGPASDVEAVRRASALLDSDPAEAERILADHYVPGDKVSEVLAVLYCGARVRLVGEVRGAESVEADGDGEVRLLIEPQEIDRISR